MGRFGRGANQAEKTPPQILFAQTVTDAAVKLLSPMSKAQPLCEDDVPVDGLDACSKRGYRFAR